MKNTKCLRPHGMLLLLFLLFIIFLDMVRPVSVQAAEATVTFGSDSYENRNGATFPVGVYIRSGQKIGDYYVEIKYDNLRLKYIDGAIEADEENGILILEGSSGRTEVKYWLYFQAISGGEAYIRVENAEAVLQDSEIGELFELTELGSAPITLSGEDTAAEEEARLLAEEQERLEAEAEAARQEEEAQAAREAARIAAEEDQKTQEESSGKKTDHFRFFYNIYVFFGVVFVLLVVLVEVIVWAILRTRKKKKDAVLKRRPPHSTNCSKSGKTDRMQDGMETVDIKDLADPEDLEKMVELGLKNEVTALLYNERMEEQYGKPVIVVEDVTMEFHLSSGNPSGLKEYLIQMLKRQITYRKLFALYHVSFKVYRGEVVGIIGTNGSGKSTLLKIVSGALKPTGGRVKVDRRKIQLLTLGTGFDMELSAKENVFLNGSIIGYSREFLEAHYDEIVEFAELGDFMEEKVKNFSSGMVSRLGFAIATAGDAAEILILDEVLSVGDEFFRKKSLKRVKEMIHGGSTVLMVSHGMGTILENCTKVVWIEKGELRMIGEPKEVCREYQRMQK